MRLRRLIRPDLCVFVATTLLGSYLSVLSAPWASAAANQTSISLTKTVTGAAFSPTLSATITADHDTALPGDDVRFTTHVTNSGAVMTLTGAFQATSQAETTGTIAAWWDEVEYKPRDAKDWVPLGGQQAAQSGYQVAVPAPATSGMQVTATPSSSDSAVTYATGPDTILGTTLATGGKANWNYTAKLTLSAQQVQVLADPKQVDGVRNVVHFEVTPRDPKNGQPYIYRADVNNPFAVSSAAISDVHVTTTLPDGSKVTAAKGDVAALGSMAPGDSADVTATYHVPVPKAKGADESDQDYLARLTAAEGTALNAASTLSGTDASGALESASAGPVTVVEHLPVVTVGKTGPDHADAGTTASYDLPLANGGGATARALDVVDALPGGANGTVTDVPDTLAAAASATAHASYAIPASQVDGPLTDTASVAWKDGNGNAYGPVTASYETDVRSSYAGASLSLDPSTAGPDVVGTRQSLTATLLDKSGNPMPGVTLHFAVSGANVAADNATTDDAGKASFSYTGTGNGTDTAQASVVADGASLQSNTATIGWIKPVQPVSSTTVDGRFFAEPTSATTFVAKPTDTPAFSQSFPSLAFNPPSGALPHDITGVTPSTRPFTDVTTDVAGDAIAPIPAQGNGLQAGVGAMSCFDAAFTANLVVAQASDVTFRFQYGTGFLFGVGGGATRVSGLYENIAIGRQTAFDAYPVVGGDNTVSSSVRSGTVTVHFPAAGAYPYEVDYTGCGSQLSLVMQTVSFDNDTSPLSIYVGYADGLRPAGSIFPYPWQGSPNVNFIGNIYTAWDSGALRFDNTSDTPMTLDTVTVDVGTYHVDNIWKQFAPNGQLVVPAHGSLILAQTIGENFDTSDYPYIHCAPSDNLVPKVNVTIDGVTTTYDDNDMVLNTKGYDQACYGNESLPWERIGGASTSVDHPLPPAASLTVTPSTHADNSVGSAQSVQISAMDGSGEPVANLPVDLTVAGANAQHVTGTTDASGNATLSYTGLHAGDDTVQVSAFVTGMRTLSNTTTVTWANPPGQTAPAPAPVVVPDLPADGSVVTTPFPVRASFTPPDGETITSWKATYRALAGGSPVTLASGDGTPPDTLATFDTTLLANDTYAITVSATSSNGGVQSVTSSVVVSGNLKLGRYQTTVRDLTVPIGGVPFHLDRTYDSYDKRTGDFGVGWQLQLGSLRTSTNRVLGAGGWSMYDTDCFFGICNTAWRTSTPHYVSVVFPDGHTESFDLTPTAGSNIFWTGTAAFTARPGTTSTLEVVSGTDISYNGDGNLYDGSGHLYNPTRFKLTTRDGRVYILDTTLGLLSYSEPSGLTVTVDNSGVHASSGPSLAFTRDSAGRVTRATGIGGQTVDYSYDGSGDLVSAVDSGGPSATYDYDSSHNLLTIKGTDGTALRTMTYGDGGRLASVTDANGATVQISDDVDAHQQTYTDGTGKLTTVTTTDDLGDIVRQDLVGDGATRTTRYTYDSAGHLLSTTDPLGRTTTSTYDATGDVLSKTDSVGNTTRFTYDSHGLPLTATDDRGATVSLTYDSRGLLASKTGATGHVTSYTYNAAGEKTSTVDPRGGLTSYAYDGNGNLVSQTDPLGRATSYAYDAQGRKVTTTDPAGGVTQYAYDAAGDTTSVTDPTGAVTKYAYDAMLRPTSTTDPLGRVTHKAYDAMGLVTSETDPLGHVTRYDYDAVGRQTTVTDATGAVTRDAYDAFGDVVSHTDPLGNVTRYGYDADGEVVSRTMPGGGHWTYGYDDGGRRTTVTDPAGSTTTTAYNLVGLPTRVEDPAGNVTKSTYALDGLLTSSTDALGHATSYGYDATGDLTKTTDALGHVTTYGYDAAGERTSTTDPTGRTTTAGYGALGMATSRTDPAGQSVAIGYDADGRPALFTRASGAAESITYDAAGQVTAITDPLGHVTTYAYDGAGRQVATTDPLGNTSHTAYDAAGHPARLTDALGGVATMDYDADGNVVRLVDPDGAATTLTYDADGQVVKQVDPSGRTLRATYDSLGRPATFTNGRGQTTRYDYTSTGHVASVTRPEETDTFSYDALGHMVGQDDGTGHTSYGYDAVGRITSVSAPGSAIGYGYDDAGRRVSMTVDSKTIDYSYDTSGRLSRQSDGSAATDYGYTEDGQLSSVQRSNGVTSAYGYDAAGQLTTIDHELADGTQHQVTYTLDAAGRQTAVTTDGTTESYAHDALGRVTGVTHDDGSKETYAYDAAGNRLSTTIGGQTTSYGYDSAGRLTKVTAPSGSTTAYAYNADDEVTQRGADSFAYDSAGHLVSVDAGGQATSYAYDAVGLRTAESSGGTTTKLGYDRLAANPHVVSDGGTVDVWGPAGLAFSSGGSGTTFPLEDALGSVRWLTDGSGALTGTATYDAFGATTSTSGATSAFGFAGERTGAGGLIDLRARSYDPGTGRFMSSDSVLHSAPGTPGLNRWAYAGNDPVDNLDPSGHEDLIEDAAFIAVLGIIVAVGLEQYMELIGNDLARGALGDASAHIGFGAFILDVLGAAVAFGLLPEAAAGATLFLATLGFSMGIVAAIFSCMDTGITPGCVFGLALSYLVGIPGLAATKLSLADTSYGPLAKWLSAGSFIGDLVNYGKDHL